MPLTSSQRRAAATLRSELDYGDRRIAKAIGATAAEVRWDREQFAKTAPLADPEGDGPAVLIFDIETAPALVWVWSQWQTNVIATEQDWYMLSFAYRWLGSDETHFVSMRQDPNFVTDTADDSFVAERLAALFDRADVVVAHNGDRFDIRKANARFLFHDIPPPSPYQSVDTKKLASRQFANYSNSLDELARVHGLGRKLAHQGFALWRGCMAGDPEAWETMEAYNRHDVDLLEALYLKLLPWGGGPNLGFWHKGETVCAGCASKDLQKRGVKRTAVSEFQVFQCQACGRYGRARKRISQKEDGGVTLV